MSGNGLVREGGVCVKERKKVWRNGEAGCGGGKEWARGGGGGAMERITPLHK